MLLLFELGRMSPKLAKVDQLTRDRFGFLHKPHFRCAFLLFIGTIPLGLGKAGKALGGLMIINALLNLYFFFVGPTEEEAAKAAATSSAQGGAAGTVGTGDSEQPQQSAPDTRF